MGKTTIIQSYINNSPEKYTNPTVGAMFLSKNLTHEGVDYKLQIWDTAGQERYKSMAPISLKDADGIILVCDLTDKSSLYGCREWVSMIKDHAPENVCLTLVGNKVDLEDHIQVSEDELRQFGEFANCEYVMVSAWHNSGVEVNFNHSGCIQQSYRGD